MKKIILAYDELNGNIYHNGIIIYSCLGIPTVEENTNLSNRSSNIDSSTITTLFNTGISIGDIVHLKEKGLL